MILPQYYEYCARVKTVSGHKALESIPEHLVSLNARKPLIITDKGVSKAGLIKQVTKAISGKKVKVGAIFDEVPMDSDYRVVNKIADLYRKKGCDAVIAVGGGSPIDTAKGVNILASLGGNDILEYSGAGAVKEKLKPFFVIPTTAGTGSEITQAAVIADPVRNIKMAFTSYFLLPDIAVLDSRMTKTLPPHLTSMTGMDAMSHSIEAYIDLGKNPLSDATALKAIQLISENLVNVVKNPKDMDGRLAMANAATLAGMAFSNSMVGLVHNLGHATGAVCHVPHGLCMSVFLPYTLEYNMHKVKSHIGELLYPLGGEKVYAETPKKERPEKTIEVLRQLVQDLHDATGGRHPRSLSEITDAKGNQMVPKEAFHDIAMTSMGDGSKVYSPEEISYDEAMLVLEHAYDGSPLNRKKVKKGKKNISF